MKYENIWNWNDWIGFAYVECTKGKKHIQSCIELMVEYFVNPRMVAIADQASSPQASSLKPWVTSTPSCRKEKDRVVLASKSVCVFTFAAAEAAMALLVTSSSTPMTSPESLSSPSFAWAGTLLIFFLKLTQLSDSSTS